MKKKKQPASTVEKTEGVVIVPETTAAPASQSKRKSKKVATAKPKTVAAFFRRYWYWFVTVPVLVAVVVVWLYFLGLFEKKEEVVLLSDPSIQTITMSVDSLYRYEVTSSTGDPVSYISSDSSIVEIGENGCLLAHDPGMAYVTAKCGTVKKRILVHVVPYAETWYLVKGDTFTGVDVQWVFKDVADTCGINEMPSQSVTYDYETDTYTVGSLTDDAIAETYDIAAYYLKAYPYSYLTSTDEEAEFVSSDAVTKGVLQVYVFEDEATRNAKRDRDEEITTLPDFSHPVTEECEMTCGEEYTFSPTVTGNGQVVFYAEEESDYVIIRQTGTLLIVEPGVYYFSVYCGDTFVCRYKMTASPRTLYTSVAPNGTFLFADYDSVPDTVVRFESASDKLTVLYDGDMPYGCKAGPTETVGDIYVNGYDESDMLIFRFSVSIRKDVGGDAREEEE